MVEFLIWGIVTAAVAVAVEYVAHRGKPFEWRAFAGSAVRNAILAFLLVTFICQALYVAEIRELVRNASKGNALARAQQLLNDMGSTALFAREAQPRLEKIRQTLERVERGEIDLESPDDVTSAWLRLFGNVSSSVRATNVISPTFWRSASNMGAKAEAAHRAAIARGVQIQRLYIFDPSDQRNVDAVQLLAKSYAEIGVTNRFIALPALERVGGYGECRNKLSALDFVVYDESIVLLVNHSVKYEVLSGRLSSDREAHVNVAAQCFDAWWQVADTALASATTSPAPM